MKIFATMFSRKWAFTGIIKVYIWFLRILHTIIQKRKSLNSVRKVSEKGIISYMSGKLFFRKKCLKKIFDNISLTFCILVNLKAFELIKKVE